MPQQTIELKDLLDKINDLEAKSAFQEDSVNQLNRVIIEQQQQMDYLNIVIEALRGAMQATNSPTTNLSLEEERPPHF